MKTHIDTVVKHYNGKTFCWDVVNEALNSTGLKPSPPWYPALENYVDVAFHAARKAGGPHVKLFYNDYSAGVKFKIPMKLKPNSVDRNLSVPHTFD